MIQAFARIIVEDIRERDGIHRQKDTAHFAKNWNFSRLDHYRKLHGLFPGREYVDAVQSVFWRYKSVIIVAICKIFDKFLIVRWKFIINFHVYKWIADWFGIRLPPVIKKHLLAFRIGNKGNRLSSAKFLEHNCSKNRTFTVFACYCCIPSHCPAERPGNYQPQTGSFNANVCRRIHPGKFAKKFFPVFRFDSDAGIADRQDQLNWIIAVICHAYIQPNKAIMGILYRVGKQVCQNLAKPHIISVKPPRYWTIDIYKEIQRFFRDPGTHYIYHIVDNRC